MADDCVIGVLTDHVGGESETVLINARCTRGIVDCHEVFVVGQ